MISDKENLGKEYKKCKVLQKKIKQMENQGNEATNADSIHLSLFFYSANIFNNVPNDEFESEEEVQSTNAINLFLSSVSYTQVNKTSLRQISTIQIPCISLNTFKALSPVVAGNMVCSNSEDLLTGAGCSCSISFKQRSISVISDKY